MRSPVVLGEIADVVMGQSPPGETYNTEGIGLPFFQGKAEFGDESPIPAKWCSAPSRVAEPGDILLSVRAPVGPTNIAETRCCIGRGLAAIRGKKEVASTCYLRYFLRRFEIDVARKGVGSTFTAINRSDIEGLHVPLPPLTQQEEIVRILDAAEELRRTRARADRRTADLIPALFYDMFGDPEDFPNLPWSQHRIESFAEVSYGLADKLDAATTQGEGTRILTISNVRLDGSIDLSVERYSLAGVHARSKAQVRKFDLLFNWRSGSPEHVGKTAIWEDRIPGEVLHVSFLLRLRPNREIVDPYYLWVLLNRIRAAGFFTRSARMQINTKFNASELSALRLPAPPLALQHRFSSLVTGIRALEAYQDESRRRLDDLFQSLLYRAFRGEL